MTKEAFEKMSPEEIVEMLVSNGFAIPNKDGTYRLSEGAETKVREIIEKHPEAYAQMFPDRVN